MLPAVVTDRVRPGTCFAPFHWSDVFGEDLAINAVTNDAVDPISLQPEFKVCAVTLSRVAPAPEADEGPKNRVLVAAHASAAQGARDQSFAISNADIAGVGSDMNRINSFAKLLGLGAKAEFVLGPQEQLYMQGFLSGLAADAGALGGVPVLPASAPVAPNARLMLDGMLAGLFSRAAAPHGGLLSADPAAPAAAVTVTILWASQIGRSEGFAAECATRIEGLGHPVRMASMDAVKPADLAAMPVLLMLASTFGDGDAWRCSAIESTASEIAERPGLSK